MKKWAFAAFGVLFSLMFCFNCVGYAALTGELTLTGTGTYNLPSIVLITNVERDSENPGNGTWDESATYYMQSVLTSSVTLSSTSSTVSLAVTVLNNTAEVQGLDAVLAASEFYSNPNITYTLENLTRPVVKKTTTNGVTTTETIPGTQIQPYSSHTFTVTFSYKQTDSTISSLALDSTLDFIFKPYSEIKPEEETLVIIEGALAQFREILNNEVSHQELLNEMENNRTSTRGDANTLTYIGNVVGANSTDSATLERLFNGQLTLNINGEPKPVTVMIKRKNIDSNTSTGSTYQYDQTSGILFWEKTETITVSGCEMTLYMTTDNMSEVRNPTVYAIVFTCRDGGEWEQLGELYLGTASRNGYAYPYDGDDYSFDTDSWRLKGDLAYVRDGATIEQVITAYKNTQPAN